MFEMGQMVYVLHMEGGPDSNTKWKVKRDKLVSHDFSEALGKEPNHYYETKNFTIFDDRDLFADKEGAMAERDRRNATDFFEKRRDLMDEIASMEESLKDNRAELARLGGPVD